MAEVTFEKPFKNNEECITQEALAEYNHLEKTIKGMESRYERMKKMIRAHLEAGGSIQVGKLKAFLTKKDSGRPNWTDCKEAIGLKTTVIVASKVPEGDRYNADGSFNLVFDKDAKLFNNLEEFMSFVLKEYPSKKSVTLNVG
jgi:hypothetical protein